MPQIEQYQSQVEAPGPVGAVSPNLEEASAVGNSISRLGGAVETASDAIYRRNSQKETTDAYTWASQKRADYFNQIKQGTADGSLDSQGADALVKQFQDEASQQSDQYSTALGKNYFDRQVARLGSTLTVKSAAAAASTAGVQNDQMLQQAQGADMQAIATDPSQFADVLQHHIEFLDTKSQENGGPLSAAQIAKARMDAGTQYAQTAIQSTAQMSPQTAKAALDSGYFHQFLNPKEIQQAYGVVHTANIASDAQYKADQNAQDQQDAADDESSKQGFLNDITSGKFDAKKVLNSNLDVDDQLKVFQVQNTFSQRQLEERPQKVAEIARRLTLPDNDPNALNNTTQILHDMATGKYNPAEGAYAMKWMPTSPENKDLKESRASLLKMTSSQFNTSTIPGIKDPNGAAKSSQFVGELQRAEDAARKAGTPVRDLYDPGSPSYMGRPEIVNKYKATPQDIFNNMAQSMKNSAVGATPTPPPAVINTPAGVPIATPTPSSKNSNVRKAGESTTEYLARMKKGN